MVLNAPLIAPFVVWTLKVLAFAPCGGRLATTHLDKKNDYPDIDVVVCCFQNDVAKAKSGYMVHVQSEIRKIPFKGRHITNFTATCGELYLDHKV